ncbi:hypothetical protein [Schlesneria paludicola]|uniref:hypothetical protein n=1 Tax=Schlesneria paludicola TaxID=360056 RepID=UPI00029A7C71|nr:hypothetical protein [Schlesneria paludicola]
MRKQIALGIVFTIVGVIASQVVSTGQDNRSPGFSFNNGSPIEQPPQDIYEQMRTLYQTLQNDAEQNRKLNPEVAERYADLRAVLLNHMAEQQLRVASGILAAVAVDVQGTPQATRAQLAMEVLNKKNVLSGASSSFPLNEKAPAK